MKEMRSIWFPIIILLTVIFFFSVALYCLLNEANIEPFKRKKIRTKRQKKKARNKKKRLLETTIVTMKPILDSTLQMKDTVDHIMQLMQKKNTPKLPSGWF